jgi:hypothetical protein
MFIKYLSETRNSNTKLLFVCDICGTEYTKIQKNLDKTKNNPLYNKDYCNKCWRTKLNNRPSHRANISKSIREWYESDSTLSERKRISMKGKNKGILNAMKRPEVAEKSKTGRKDYISSPDVRLELSRKVKEAWANGKYDGVRVGQCKWINYKTKTGEDYKVQGTWELAFIRWLDENDMSFKCHRGRLSYQINDSIHSYYPDFWVDDWQCWVDVKAKYFYSQEKFEAIRVSNPDEEIKVLFKEDLESLGVVI